MTHSLMMALGIFGAVGLGARSVEGGTPQLYVAVAVRDNLVCAAGASGRATGERVTLVDPSQHLRFASGALAGESGADCGDLGEHDLSTPHRQILVQDKTWPRGSVLVAAVGSFEVRKAESGVELVGAAGAGSLHLKSCASLEGIHVTAWQGVPLASERLWHEYVYLGYELEPSCLPMEYEP